MRERRNINGGKGRKDKGKGGGKKIEGEERKEGKGRRRGKREEGRK